jgi:predicted lipid-binding transport protein (Tim44 family)
MQDLIITPDEVIDKSLRTTGLLFTLAKKEPLFNPDSLREWIRDFFHEVQECWQSRAPDRVRNRMTPQAFAKYDQLIWAMRRNHEINRIDDLHVRRLEFVHVSCPAEVQHHTLTALITFEAKAYFVDETSGAYVRGAQQTTWFQEFWTFHRDCDCWNLHQVQESWADAPLHAQNQVDGLSDVELQNVELGVILL